MSKLPYPADGVPFELKLQIPFSGHSMIAEWQGGQDDRFCFVGSEIVRPQRRLFRLVAPGSQKNFWHVRQRTRAIRRSPYGQWLKVFYETYTVLAIGESDANRCIVASADASWIFAGDSERRTPAGRCFPFIHSDGETRFCSTAASFGQDTFGDSPLANARYLVEIKK